MQEKKPSRVRSKVYASKVLVHTGMGAGMGLILGTLLLVLYPAFAIQLERQGHLTIWFFAGALATAFAIGATLTGIVFMGADVPPKR